MEKSKDSIFTMKDSRSADFWIGTQEAAMKIKNMATDEENVFAFIDAIIFTSQIVDFNYEYIFINYTIS